MNLVKLTSQAKEIFMLRVRIHSSYKDHLDEDIVANVKKAIKFSMDYLKINDYNHTVKFYFVETLDSQSPSEGKAAGRYETLRNLKNSNIYINASISKKEIIKTIFHEMTHLKQVLKQEVCFTPFGKSWKGSCYPKDSDYWNLPDEIDARLHENNMYKRWALVSILEKVGFIK
jgi:hypothetical protein